MKKGLVVFAVLLLAIPAVSFAGSATSMWDLTIGGYVKVDAGWTSQGAGTPPSGLEQYFPDRNDQYGNQNVANKSGSFAMETGQTTLNFLVKGPDTWGAKTSAFIQGNFYGQTTNSGNAGTRNGTFTLTHAYMDFTWANTKLIVGTNWQSWGFQPSYTFLGVYDLLLAGRGNTVPQITLVQTLPSHFYGSVGIQEPYNYRDQLGGSANLGQATPPAALSGEVLAPASSGSSFNSYARVTTNMPDFTGEFGYKSEVCGKIGPNMTQFAVGGFWGQDNIIYLDALKSQNNTYNVAKVDRWGTAFKAFIPVIPEKNLNKTGAFSVSGSLWTGQNLSNWFLGARAIDALVPYSQSYSPVTGIAQYRSPVMAGGWGQLSYYFTDKVYINGLYAYDRSATSNAYDNAFPNEIKQWQQYIGNIIYDVNPAVRVGVEYSYVAASFMRYGLNNGGVAGPANEQLTGANGVVYTLAPGSVLSSKGEVQTGRIAFWYFF
jgi:hypothetical protein